MLRLLALLAGLALLALILFARRDGSHDSLLVPFEPDTTLAADSGLHETEQPLESLEDTTDLRHAPTPDALPRVFGHLELGGDAQLLLGAKVRVVFEDHHDSALGAEEAHARCLELPPAERPLEARVANVRRDGWWYVDLPGKCWLVQAEYQPSVATPEMPPTLAAALLDDPSLENTRPRPGSKGARRFVAQRQSIPGRQTIARALERGKFEVALTVESGLCARGLVLDADTQQPIAGAQLALKSMRAPCLMTTSAPDGSFRMPGIEPAGLKPVDGCLVFVVEAPRYAGATRSIAWDATQEGLPAFRVYLKQGRR